MVRKKLNKITISEDKANIKKLKDLSESCGYNIRTFKIKLQTSIENNIIDLKEKFKENKE